MIASMTRPWLTMRPRVSRRTSPRSSCYYHFEGEPEPAAVFVSPPLPCYRSRKELLIRSMLINLENSCRVRDVSYYDEREDLLKALSKELCANDAPPIEKDMCDDLEPWSLECKIFDL